MKAIVAYTNEEYIKMQEKYRALINALDGHNRQELFAFTKRRGYAKYTFEGHYTDKLVELLGHIPDEEEIIMLVDSGYSHFGAGCTINARNKTFSGHVYID